MKVIVAGGRNLAESRPLLMAVEEILIKLEAKAVVSGCARGGDAIGEKVGRKLGLEILKFPAVWVIPDSGGMVDRSAGFKRNEQMALSGNTLIALPGGSGTEDMVRRAISHGLDVYRVDQDGEARIISAASSARAEERNG